MTVLTIDTKKTLFAVSVGVLSFLGLALSWIAGSWVLQTEINQGRDSIARGDAQVIMMTIMMVTFAAVGALFIITLRYFPEIFKDG